MIRGPNRRTGRRAARGGRPCPIRSWTTRRPRAASPRCWRSAKRPQRRRRRARGGRPRTSSTTSWAAPSYYTDAWGGQVPDVPDDADLPTRYATLRRGARGRPAASRACSTRWCRHRSAAASCPASVMLGIYTSDTLIHTWDLARAIGIDVQLDQDLLQRTLGRPDPDRGAGAPPGGVRARRRHRRRRPDAGPGDGLVRPSALSA